MGKTMLISFAQFREDDSSPIYQQIIRYIKQGIASGEIHSGDELPSRRVLSALLGVNPNTIQKAYRLLEDEGLVESHSGAKSFMVLSENSADSLRNELVTGQIRQIVDQLRRTGLTRQQAIDLIHQLWEEN